jgi:nitrate reductase alpha subunit
MFHFPDPSHLSDEWVAPTQGTDAALAMTMGHVILKEYHLDNKSDYFTSYIKQYTDNITREIVTFIV